MATNTATEKATYFFDGEQAFSIAFSKKALSAQTLKNMEAHKRLNGWIHNPLITKRFGAAWESDVVDALCTLTFEPQTTANIHKHRRRALVQALQMITESTCEFNQSAILKVHERCVQYPQCPESSHHYRRQDAFSRINRMAGIKSPTSGVLPAQTQSLFAWLNGDAVKRLPLEHRALLALHYGLTIHPFEIHNACVWFVLFYGCLVKAGFGAIAQLIVTFYADNIERTAVVLSTQNQQAWFDYFLHAWASSIETAENAIESHLKEALFKNALQSCVEAHEISERAHGALIQLLANPNIRSKKALYGCAWYKTLYKKVSTRTQERDFKALCECGFITLHDKQRFGLTFETS